MADRVLLCGRVRDKDPAVQARVGRCNKCGAAIWISESSPKRVTQTWCIACAVIFMDRDAKVEKPTKKQLREIKQFIRDE